MFDQPPPPLRAYEPPPTKRSKIPLWVIILLFVGSVIMCSPCLSAFSTSNNTVQTVSKPADNKTAEIRHSPTPTSSPTHVAVIIATKVPTVTATAKPRVVPSPIPTQPPDPPVVKKSVQQQPSGPVYNSDPNGGSLVYNPPSNFCTTHSCVSTFWLRTNGYVVECNNGLWSHSGGVRGSCSRDGGESSTDLYQH